MSAPNLLFLMSDQQRADTLAPDSPCLTPHLDALAATGTRFERCYAPNPICSPTRATVLTGLYPHTHGMVDVTHAVEPYRASFDVSLPLWSQRLKGAGYRTGYFGKWHVERSDDLARFGFDEYEVDHTGYQRYRRDRGWGPTPELAQAHHVRQKGYRDFLLYGVTDEPAESSYEHYLYSRGIDFLERASKRPEQPWMLFVSTDGPHDPYVVPREHYERYRPEALPLPESFGDDLADRPAIYRRAQEVWEGMTAAHFREAMACYYAFCSLIDDQVGRLLAALEAGGQAENTIVVYTSDHGDLMGAHRLLLKGIPPFEEGYRVPLLLRGPGIPRGAVRGEAVSLIDLAASIVPLTTRDDFPCQGRSLRPLLDGEGGAWVDEAFAECHGQRFNYTQRILWQGQHKYVFNGFDRDELYDLADDPHELRNLARDERHRPLMERMAARMWGIMHETGDRNMVEAQYGMFRFAPVGPDGGRPGEEGA